MQRWWCKKFTRPRKDPLLATYTVEELMIEYMEDAIEMDSGEAFPAHVLENGIQFRGTGDAMIDKWEAEIATGKEPDFAEAFAGSEDRKLFEAWIKPKKAAAPATVTAAPALPDPTEEELPEWVKEFTDGDGFNDSYNKE